MVEISITVPVACGPYVSDFEITIAPVTPVSQTQSHVIFTRSAYRAPSTSDAP
jgi:hypothetical protein